MRATWAMAATVLLTVTSCGDDETSGGDSLDTAAAATAAQAAIDEGDSLGDCPWDQRAVVDAVGKVVTLAPEFAELGTSDGQVFRGGEVDITYCENYHTQIRSESAEGVDMFRIDVHPGTADLQQYLDEEWGGDAEGAEESKLLGGTVNTLCFDDHQCLAAWQGDGLFVALETTAVGGATASAEDALAALKVSLPIVVAGLIEN